MADAGAGDGAAGNPVDGVEVAGDELLINGVCVAFLAGAGGWHGALGKRRQKQGGVRRRKLVTPPRVHQ